MKHANAMIIARHAWDVLKPHCSQCKIAGSLRRKKAEVKDIEIVAIPKQVEDVADSPDLFDTNTVRTWARDPAFVDAVHSLGGIVKGKPDKGKQIQVLTAEGIVLDIYIATPDNWGYILTIRTGAWEFGKALFGRANKLGYKGDDGMLTKDGKPIAIRTEEEYFATLRMRMPDPKDRELGAQGLKPWIIY